MDFYERYTAWRDCVTKVVDILHPMASEADWQRILQQAADIEKWVNEINETNFWGGFEQFVLTTEPAKVTGFMLTVEARLDQWVERWRKTYKHENHQEFIDWFNQVAESKLVKNRNEANRIARLIIRADNAVHSIVPQFEQLKTTYTTLPPHAGKLFYERIKDRFIDPLVESPYHKHTYADWLSGNMDAVLVRCYLAKGEDIKPLIWPDKWEQFNNWIESEYKNPRGLSTELDLFEEKVTVPVSLHTIEELIDLVVNRIAKQAEGNKLALFRHQAELYPSEDLRRIRAEMAKIHDQLVRDNWYHWQKWIDQSIRGSVNARMLIENTLKQIEGYLAGRAVVLKNPVYTPRFVSQPAVVDAYQSLLRGDKVMEYVRPLKTYIKPFRSYGQYLSPLMPGRGNLREVRMKSYRPQHPTSSPFVEAELLLKAKAYLEQQFLELGFVTNAEGSLDFTLNYMLTESQIESLFTQLRNDKFIDPAVELAQFSAMLTGAEPTDKPVKWIKTNGALTYLFTRMLDEEMIDNPHWQQAIEQRNLFINKGGKQLNAHDLGVAKSNYIVPPSSRLSKKKRAEINRINAILEEVKAKAPKRLID